MSTCGRTPLLERLVLDEVGPALAEELHAHVAHCGRCRHELNWLESEAKLFRERAGRDEVAYLWSGVERRQRSRRRAWPRVWAALAASAAVALGLGVRSWGGGPPEGVAAQASVDMSEPVMSTALTVEHTDNCSRMPEGLGFSCGPAIPASFLATR
jgi:hypothetical protein